MCQFSRKQIVIYACIKCNEQNPTWYQGKKSQKKQSHIQNREKLKKSEKTKKVSPPMVAMTSFWELVSWVWGSWVSDWLRTEGARYIMHDLILGHCSIWVDEGVNMRGRTPKETRCSPSERNGLHGRLGRASVRLDLGPKNTFANFGINEWKFMLIFIVIKIFFTISSKFLNKWSNKTLWAYILVIWEAFIYRVY